MRFNQEPTLERLSKYQCTEDGKDLEIKLGVILFDHLILEEGYALQALDSWLLFSLLWTHVASHLSNTKCVMPRFGVKTGFEDSNQGEGSTHGLNRFMKHFLRATQKSERGQPVSCLLVSCS